MGKQNSRHNQKAEDIEEVPLHDRTLLELAKWQKNCQLLETTHSIFHLYLDMLTFRNVAALS